jgi:hypothetical protein
MKRLERLTSRGGCLTAYATRRPSRETEYVLLQRNSRISNAKSYGSAPAGSAAGRMGVRSGALVFCAATAIVASVSAQTSRLTQRNAAINI